MKKTEIRDQLTKLLKHKENLERGILGDGRYHPKTKKLIENWQQFCSLKPEQQELVRRDWDAYHTRVYTTTAAKRFFAQGKAWKANNIPLVQGYAAKATQQVHDQTWEVPTPALEDPDFMDNSQVLIHYRAMIAKINDLQKQTEGYGVLAF